MFFLNNYMMESKPISLEEIYMSLKNENKYFGMYRVLQRNIQLFKFLFRFPHFNLSTIKEYYIEPL